MNSFSKLRKKSLAIIFAYAPAGFGHLRVTDALYHGLPEDVAPPHLLGSQDTTITILHRIMSINPIIAWLSQWVEWGILEDIATAVYRWYLRSEPTIMYNQMLTILEQSYEQPTTVLIVSTHFGLAHQLAAIKKRLEKQRNIRIILVVQVTDDSPHHIWFVADADVIFVPSQKTKEGLMRYAKKLGDNNPRIEVVAYPLSPVLGMPLTISQMGKRVHQVDPLREVPVHIAIPISGAAVGTQFFTIMIDELHKLLSRCMFHVVVKNAAYTQTFLLQMQRRNYVNLHVAIYDRDIVDAYERLYQKNVIALEITKPSEQAFKALFDCEKRGASLLLFTEPVGKQEYDNLDFLYRHHLIPSASEEKKLHNIVLQAKAMTEEDKEILLRKAATWRGISLPKNPTQAAQFTAWCLQNGVFSAMITCKVAPREDDPNKHEVDQNGVAQFWQKVETILP